MFPMPRFGANLAAFFSHKFRHNDPLGRREVDDGEGCRVFDGIIERPPALVEWCPVFDKALSEPNEIRDAIQRNE